MGHLATSVDKTFPGSAMSDTPRRQPMKISHQYRAAAIVGAVGAGFESLLEVLGSGNSGSLGTFIPIALAIALPFGAICGVTALALGRLACYLLSKRFRSLRPPAMGAAIVVFLVGMGVTIMFGLEPQRIPFLWPAVVATLIGALGIYLQMLLRDTPRGWGG